MFSFTDELPCETLGNNYRYILGNCYYLEATAYNFTEASENCKNCFGNHGTGILFEPRMQILNDAVIKEARRTVTTSYLFWMGVRDSDSNNNWQYVSSNQKVIWTNWAPGQPDNNNGDPENCVTTYGVSGFKWNDGPCQYPYPSICELTN